jgi:YVTN family beta-propeller protein
VSAGIFISYRREDTAGHAGRLYDRLSERFGEDQVFMDLTIEPGADFVRRIDEGVASCAVLIALIGDEWLSAEVGGDGRRLDDPRDFVRLEISSALERGIPVIPVLVHGASMPQPEELPDALAQLARRNAIELSDTRWAYDVGRLIETLSGVLRSEPPGAGGRFRWLRAPRSRLGRRSLLAGLAALVAAGVAALAVALLSDGGAARATSTIDVGAGPDGIVAQAGSVWVVNSGDDTVSRIDADRKRVTETIDVGGNPDSVAVGAGSVWVTNTGDGTVSRIDGRSGRVQEPSIPVGSKPEGITVGFGTVWVVNSGEDTVATVDIRSNRPSADRIRVGREPRDIEAGEGAVWVTDRDGTVRRIDPGRRRVTGKPIRVGGVLRGIRVALGAVWVANADDGTVVQIDPATGRQVGSPIPVGARPVGLALSADAVWVGNSDGTLIEIDVKARQTEGEAIDVGDRPIGVAVGEGAVWAANNGSGTVTRVGL